MTPLSISTMAGNINVTHGEKRKADGVIEPNGYSSYAKQHELTAEHAMDRHDLQALLLDERGMIQDCSKSFELLCGFRRSDLVWHHVSLLFPQLTGIELVQKGQINPFLNYLCHCGHLYQVKDRQGDTFPSNLSLIRVEYGGRKLLRLIVRACDKLAAR